MNRREFLVLASLFGTSMLISKDSGEKDPSSPTNMGSMTPEIEKQRTYQDLVTSLESNGLKVQYEYSKDMATDRILIFVPDYHTRRFHDRVQMPIFLKLINDVGIDAIGLESTVGEITREKITEHQELQKEYNHCKKESWNEYLGVLREISADPEISADMKMRFVDQQQVYRDYSEALCFLEISLKHSNARFTAGYETASDLIGKSNLFGLENPKYDEDLESEYGSFPELNAARALDPITRTAHYILSNGLKQKSLFGLAMYCLKLHRKFKKLFEPGQAPTFEGYKRFKRALIDSEPTRNAYWLENIKAQPIDRKVLVIQGGVAHVPDFFTQCDYSIITIDNGLNVE